MIVVSDTSPLHYLVLIKAEQVLPKLYGRVLVPSEVLDELRAEEAPDDLRTWIEFLPSWLEVESPPPYSIPTRIHAGEAAAVALAKHLQADLLLIDDHDARDYAESQGFKVTGMLGVLRDAAELELLDLAASLRRLQQETNFRAPRSLFDDVMDEFRRRKRSI